MPQQKRQMEKSTKEKILSYLRKHKISKSMHLTKHLSLSRKTIAMHLKNLVSQKKIFKTGSTKKALYSIEALPKHITPISWSFVKQLKNIEEHVVFSEIDLRLGLHKHLNSKTYDIIQYAFTEMFNNAIDHANSKTAKVLISLSFTKLDFFVRDYGVGLFRNIQDKFGLHSEYEAVDHVLKGRQTTLPDHHTGEGLFFTSRIADEFIIRSHRLNLTIDNEKKDYRLCEKRFLTGTDIYFSIKKQTRKKLKEFFDQYANENFEFNTSEIRIKLSADAGNISRSQARRLCTGLDKFEHVIFDFQGVKEIGQAFADEIFRVYAQQHSNQRISFNNAADPVEFMIMRSLRS